MTDGIIITLPRPAAQPRVEYRLRYLGDPSLTTPTIPVRSLADVPLELVQQMKHLMGAGWTQGVGIAANQIGATQRICIITIAGDTGRDRLVLINPKLIEHSPEAVLRVEACLSMPGFSTSMRRYDSVTVEYRDEEWKLRRLTVHQFDAQVVQHELDHLDGKTIADGLSRQQRRQAQRAALAYQAKVAR